MKEKQVPVIAWDCDDVLVLTGHDLVAQYNKLYGTSVQAVDLYSHGRAEEVWGASQSEASERVEAIIREERHESLSPDLSATTVVHDLASFCENHVVTSRSYEREAATRLMLDTHFAGAIKEVHFANSYAPGLDPNLRRTKSSICLAIGAMIAIDDNYSHIDDIIGNSPVELPILFGDHDWNRDVETDSRVIRCRTMDEVHSEVGRFASRYAS